MRVQFSPMAPSKKNKMIGKKCIIVGCVNEQMKSSRYCSLCYKKHKAEMSKKHYQEHGKGIGICEICQTEYTRTNSNQKYCKDCFSKIAHATTSSLNSTPYHRTSDHSTEHRHIAKNCSKTVFDSEVIHHVDLNTRNNAVENLIIMSRSDHAKFHSYLKQYLVKYPDENLYALSKKVLEDYNIPFKNLNQ